MIKLTYKPDAVRSHLNCHYYYSSGLGQLLSLSTNQDRQNISKDIIAIKISIEMENLNTVITIDLNNIFWNLYPYSGGSNFKRNRPFTVSGHVLGSHWIYL